MNCVCIEQFSTGLNVKHGWPLTQKKKLKDRDTLRELARTTNDPDTWKSYRTLRNEVNRQVNSDRKRYYDNIYSRHHLNNDVGATYRAAKNQVGWTKNLSPVSFVHEGSKITDPQRMADLQMKVFTNKTEKLIEELLPASSDPCKTLQETLNKWGNTGKILENSSNSTQSVS